MKGQFRAANISYAARQAARAHGLATIGSYDVLSNERIIDEELATQQQMDTVVIVAYSPAGNKAVNITANDMFYYESILQDSPAARSG